MKTSNSTKKTTLSIFLFTCIATVLMTAAYAKPINLVTVEWTPYYGSSLKDGGIVVDISTEAFKKVGYELKVDYIPWKRALIEGAKGDRYHGVLGGYYSEERSVNYSYSDAITDTSTVLFKRADDNISYTTLKDLAPYKVGVMRGAVNGSEFDAATYIKKEEVTNQSQNIKKLADGRIDLMVGSRKVILNEINNNLPDLVDKIEAINPPLQSQDLHILISKKAPGYEQIIKDFNLGLEKIKADGTYDKLMEKHGF